MYAGWEMDGSRILIATQGKYFVKSLQLSKHTNSRLSLCLNFILRPPQFDRRTLVFSSYIGGAAVAVVEKTIDALGGIVGDAGESGRLSVIIRRILKLVAAVQICNQ